MQYLFVYQVFLASLEARQLTRSAQFPDSVFGQAVHKRCGFFYCQHCDFILVFVFNHIVIILLVFVVVNLLLIVKSELLILGTSFR